MKKILLASALAFTASTAFAWEIGITGNRDYAGDNRNGAGVVVANQYGAFGVAAAFDRTSVGDNDQNRYSVTGSYDVPVYQNITVGPRVGVAYLNNQSGRDGYALVAGVGARVPVTDTVAITVDYTRQRGEESVKGFDGNRYTVGVRYGF